MKREPLSLDVASPDDVGDVLRYAASQFPDSAKEFACGWQDPNAGQVWAKIAQVLDDAANRTDELV